MRFRSAIQIYSKSSRLTVNRTAGKSWLMRLIKNLKVTMPNISAKQQQSAGISSIRNGNKQNYELPV